MHPHFLLRDGTRSLASISAVRTLVPAAGPVPCCGDRRAVCTPPGPGSGVRWDPSRGPALCPSGLPGPGAGPGLSPRQQAACAAVPVTDSPCSLQQGLSPSGHRVAAPHLQVELPHLAKSRAARSGVRHADRRLRYRGLCPPGTATRPRACPGRVLGRPMCKQQGRLRQCPQDLQGPGAFWSLLSLRPPTRSPNICREPT